MDIQIRTDIGRARLQNEDAVASFKKDKLFFIILADGLGGHTGGEMASKMVIDEMINYIKKSDEKNIKNLLIDGAKSVNRIIYEKQKYNKEYQGMGSTIVAACIEKDKTHIIHAGDSRAYHFTANKLVQITVDHSVKNTIKIDEINEIMKNMLTRAMGTEEDIELDYQAINLKKDDILILCSDGLTNELKNYEIEEILLRKKTLSDTADKLIREANEKGGKDNISIALSKYEELEV